MVHKFLKYQKKTKKQDEQKKMKRIRKYPMKGMKSTSTVPFIGHSDGLGKIISGTMSKPKKPKILS